MPFPTVFRSVLEAAPEEDAAVLQQALEQLASDTADDETSRDTVPEVRE